MAVSLRTRLYAVLQSLASSAWFAYGSLALLQFKVVYGIWFFRDLTFGDTSAYFSNGTEWYYHGLTNIAWSPLYTTFYGSLLNFSHDAYIVTTLHRLIIVFTISLLLLALMRRLLPHSIAWLITAWWVILPINFDALYEVHLFAVIPTLIAFLVALYKPNIWTRGAALGIFLAAAFLSRNELFVATGLWALACLIWEVAQARKGQGVRLLRYVLAYGVPVAAALALTVVFYTRSAIQFPELSAELNEKHTLNVCQIYAYSYQQRYTDWTKSPWIECQDLMQRDFGVPQPSMFEAIRLNPRAMLDYFLWNVRLMPDGIQVLLFGASAGTGQPDYIPRITNEAYAGVLSLIALATVVIGLWLIRRDHWWERWIKDRVWGWIALLCVVVVMFIVMLSERPRPSYLFNLGFFLTAVIGMCAAAIIDRVIGIRRFALLMPIAALVLIAAIPSYFSPEYQNPGGATGRNLLTQYERIAPYSNLLEQPNAHLLGNGWVSPLCLYINTGSACAAVDYYGTFLPTKPADVSFADWLTQEKITVFYADEGILADPKAKDFLDHSDADGWDTVAAVQTSTAHWRLLARRAS